MNSPDSPFIPASSQQATTRYKAGFRLEEKKKMRLVVRTLILLMTLGLAAFVQEPATDANLSLIHI